MSSDSLRAVLYARISEDATGEGSGVERQLRDARKLAEVRGWDVLEEFSDNDISALTGAQRPAYERLRERVESGGVDRIVVWHTSRLWRNRSERARDIGALAKQRCGVIAVKGPDLDLSTAYGRGLAGLLGEFDTMESEVKGERVAAAAADRARRGRPNGGLGYGWRKVVTEGAPVTYVEEPAEAAVVREVTDRLLRGDTLRTVTAWLNESGTPPPGATMNRTKRAEDNPEGARWNKTSVKKLALRPSNAALRVHHRGQPDEVMHEGNWPALVPRDRWETLRALLTSPERATKRPGRRRHLLTWGVGYCGVCGSVLRASLKSGRYGKPQSLYVCDAKGCTGRNEAAVDELIGGIVIERLTRPDALDVLAGDDDRAAEAVGRARTLRARLDEVADKYAEGTVTIAQLERITARLRKELEAAEAERQKYARIDLRALADVAGPEAAARWERLDIAQRRAVVEALGIVVHIDPVKRRGPGFDPESVRVEW